jgi:glycosyltransferase involved in cell wall biosynthesis
MKALGHEAVVVAPGDNPEFVRKVRELSFIHYSIPVVLSRLKHDECGRWRCVDLYRLFKRKHSSYCRLFSVVNKEQPDIIHTNIGAVQEGFFCAKRMGIPHVWHLREYQDKDFQWRIQPSRSILKMLLRHSYTISITHDIQESFGLYGEKHRHIYSGVFPAAQVAMDFPKEKYFLCASRISPEKGYEEVIRTFARFHETHPDFSLIILGCGKPHYVNRLKEYCAHVNGGESVIFLGFQENVLPYMRKATALIVGSYYEGMGRMTAEAAFCGCLVIGRNTGGTKEILMATGGYLFDHEEKLLSQMNEMALMPDELYKKVVLHAQKQAVRLFSEERYVSSVEQFYQKIILH